MKRLFGIVLAAVTLLAAPSSSVAKQRPTAGIDSFVPLSTFTVPGGGVAEIVSSTPDGQTLIYTNSEDEQVGIVDISDPANPVHVQSIPVGGEPTSVSVVPDGTMALAVVKTSYLEEGEAPVIKPGQLIAIELPSGNVLGQLEIGNGPDSIATSRVNGSLTAVIAIENEPIVIDNDGNLTDEEEPGKPNDISGPGYVQVITVNTADIATSSVTDVFFSAATLAQHGLFFPNDPQPEFVEIRNNRAAVTLQENNGIAIIELVGRSPKHVSSVFSTGNVEIVRLDGSPKMERSRSMRCIQPM